MKVYGLGFPNRFRGNFATADENQARVRKQLERATRGDTLRVIAMKHIEWPAQRRVRDGFVATGRNKDMWVGQAISGPSAMRFLHEFFALPQKLDDLSQRHADRAVKRVLESKLGKKFDEHPRLYDTLVSFSRMINLPGGDPVVDLVNNPPARRERKERDPWESDPDGWKSGQGGQETLGGLGEDWGLGLDDWKKGRDED